MVSLVNYWILTFSEYTDFALGSAEELFDRLKQDGKWLIGPHTQNRKCLQKDDLVIFYQAGEGGKRFVGNAVLDSGFQPPEGKDLFGFTRVSKIDLWSQPVPISAVGKKLSFVKNRNPSQFYFQMGVRRISARDYDIITTAEKRCRLGNESAKMKDKSV